MDLLPLGLPVSKKRHNGTTEYWNGPVSTGVHAASRERLQSDRLYRSRGSAGIDFSQGHGDGLDSFSDEDVTRRIIQTIPFLLEGKG